MRTRTRRIQTRGADPPTLELWFYFARTEVFLKVPEVKVVRLRTVQQHGGRRRQLFGAQKTSRGTPFRLLLLLLPLTVGQVGVCIDHSTTHMSQQR